jgi:hypothetical protein
MTVILRTDRKNAVRMDYEEAIEVLRRWHGRQVTVVAFVEPGVSLRPFAGELATRDAGGRTVQAAVDTGDREVRIAFPAATFHEASWVPGQEEVGISVVQGATRVDVFVE